MKLLFSSDLHGLEAGYREFAARLKEGDYDVGVLAGDLMTFPSEEALASAAAELGRGSGSGAGAADAAEEAQQVVQLALQRMEHLFKTVLGQSGKPVVFVMGNDDGLLGDGRAWKSEQRIVDIHLRRVRFRNHFLVGYHFTDPFVGGTFEKSEEEQEHDFRILEHLIDDATVLVTHGPPWGTLDQGWDGKHFGSRALADLVARKPPRMHLFGHIHQSFGIDGTSVNGSYPSSRKFIGIDFDRAQARVVPE